VRADRDTPRPRPGDADYRSLVARAWCRVDLAGGTLDIWPLGVLHPGAKTVNTAIDLGVTARLEDGGRRFRIRQGKSSVEAESAAKLAATNEGALPGLIMDFLGLPPVDLTLESASPRGGGLGASSAMAVAIIGAGEAWMGHEPSSPERRSALARDLEARLMGLPTGRQDHYPALLGGALEVAHELGGEKVRRLDVDLERLGDSLVVAYTGQSHFSAGNNWRIVRGRLNGDPELVGLFDGIGEVAVELSEALEAGALPRVGRLMGREWSLRRRLADGISTPLIETLLEAAVEAGAWGGKACGAGGGGCIAVLCPAGAREAVEKSLVEGGARLLPARPTTEPLLVEARVA
jgi:D-glycero-alpha-D-manno-heptose-7-phosphate kinase